MNLNSVLQKSWRMLWNYKALWLFGLVLALVGASFFFPGPWREQQNIDQQNNDQWLKIKISEWSTIRMLPGVDMTIDLTTPGGVRITPPPGTSWREFRDLVEVVNDGLSINLWPILIELGVMLVGMILLGTLARYIAETALIRMVDETEGTGKRLGVWAGLRRGFSLRAGRLFLLDLAIALLAAVALAVVFGVAVAPVLLAIGSHEVILITAGMGTLGLLVLAFWLWVATSLVLSLFLQPVRRACVLEQQGLAASIRQGILMTRHHLKDVGLLWLIWMGIRLLWIPLGTLIVILLAPVLVLTALAGLAAGGVLAIPVALIASLFVGGATPWVMGALAGVPILIVVMVLPVLFVNGLVVVYASSIWTLGYRDLRVMEPSLRSPRISLAPAQGAAD